MKVFAVIIAGGSGERLWPLSTPERPKQFVSLFGGKPLIRHAMDRLEGLVAPSEVLVVTANSLVAQTKQSLPGLPAKNILAEPCRRNTAPAVALATREAKRRGGSDAICCILTADQLMEPAAKFRQALKKAIAIAAKQRKIVTLGIKPTYPATGFGYIDSAAVPPRFVEKPDAKKAAKFLKKGTYLWNSGMFIYRVDTMEKALREFSPDTARILDAKDWSKLYPSLTSISIDYAVMEKTKEIAVVPASFRWDDVGSWASVADHFAHDGEGNTRLGKTAVLGTRDSVVVSTDDHLTAVVGLDDVVVVHTKAATLICPKSKAQEVKRLLRLLLLTLIALPVFAERYSYERYTNIVYRQMFGKLPEGFDPNKPPSAVQKTTSKEQKELTKEQEKVKSQIHFSMINVTPAGETVVGFTDKNDPKNVRNYYLKVGEGDPWKVEAADPTNATMTIVNLQTGYSFDFALGAQSADATKPASSAASDPAPRDTPRSHSGDFDRKPGMTLRHLRSFSRKNKEEQAAREAERKKEEQEKAAREAEEKQRREEERAQMKQELSDMKETLRLQREENARKESERKADEAKAAEEKAAEDKKPDEEPE